MITPSVLHIGLWTAIPVLATFYLSFTDFNVFNAPQWIWFENYIELFQDPVFLRSIGNTVAYTFWTVPASMAVAAGDRGGAESGPEAAEVVPHRVLHPAGHRDRRHRDGVAVDLQPAVRTAQRIPRPLRASAARRGSSTPTGHSGRSSWSAPGRASASR